MRPRRSHHPPRRRDVPTYSHVLGWAASSVPDVAHPLGAGPNSSTARDWEMPSGLRGLCVKIADQWTLVINAADDQDEQCFTMAHELGHVCLGHGVVAGPGSEEDIPRPRAWPDA
jgi:IrrE N-terminal-like domain